MIEVEFEFDFKWDHLGDLVRALDELEDECERIIRGLTVSIWNGILLKTPQFLGRTAASWTYSLDAPVFVDRSDVMEGELAPASERYDPADPGSDEYVMARYRGHRTAITYANMQSLGVPDKFKLGQTVFISNGAREGEEKHVTGIEGGWTYLRAVNRPGRPMKRTLDAVQARYGEDISPQQAVTLKFTRIEL